MESIQCKIDLLLLSVLIACNGCTAPILEAARGKDHAIDPSIVLVKAESARVVTDVLNGFHYTWIDICLSRYSPQKSSKEYFLERISDPIYSQPPFSFTEQNGTLVYHSSSNGGALHKGCEIPLLSGEKVESNKEIPIVTVPEDGKIIFDSNLDQAIYASYENQNMIGLGYFSAKPFFTKYHNFNIDMANTDLYKERKGRKTFLLALTPITAVGDLVAGTVLFSGFVIACTGQDNCK